MNPPTGNLCEAGPGPRQPFIGASRTAACGKTLAVVTAKLRRHSKFTGQRLLDVGCGEGSFTVALSGDYQEVFAIDVQAQYVQAFKAQVGADPRFHVEQMSASAMSFPSDYFDTLLSIETLEHIPDLPGAVAEFGRVVKPGGECLLTCPNRWFPFENHGVRWRGRDISGRVPLLPYLPPLHDLLSLARVFTVRSLDRLFTRVGFRRVTVDYLWPTFEHGGNRLQPLLRPLFGLMRRMENSPLRMFGSSVVVKYLKQDRGPGAA
jgi:SAM-dependent methyltransferase